MQALRPLAWALTAIEFVDVQDVCDPVAGKLDWTVARLPRVLLTGAMYASALLCACAAACTCAGVCVVWCVVCVCVCRMLVCVCVCVCSVCRGRKGNVERHQRPRAEKKTNGSDEA